MNNVISREELHLMIDNLPDTLIQAMTPFIAAILDEHWKPVIEPASQEEIALCDKRMKDYENNPESFIPLTQIS